MMSLFRVPSRLSPQNSPGAGACEILGMVRDATSLKPRAFNAALTVASCCSLPFVRRPVCVRLAAISAAEAITAATINGAHALRMASRAGSLEPGKQADVIVVNASDYREIPYYFGVNNVHLTIQQGKIVS